jgi:hypothetical protein
MTTEKINEYLIHIRTEDCQKLNGTLNSFFSFILKPAIAVSNIQNNLSIKLSSAELPYSFYTVNAYNNTFNIVENGTPRAITITKGSYDIFDFRDLIKSLLGANFTVSVSVNTGKMTIINSTLTTIGLTFTSDAFKLLGFSNQIYSATGSIGLTSPNIISLFSITGIYLKSNVSGYNIYNTRLNNNLSSILQLIQIEQDAFNMINYRSTTDAFISKLNDKNIDQLTFRFTDQEDNLIDFNGIDFEFTLKIFENKNIIQSNNETNNQLINQPTPVSINSYQPFEIDPINKIIENERLQNILNKIKNI